MLKIEIAKRVAKLLVKLPPKHTRQLTIKIQDLRKNPEPHDSQILKGHDPYRRADVGEYRIVYFVQRDTLIVDLVGKRNDDEIYKRLKRLNQ